MIMDRIDRRAFLKATTAAGGAIITAPVLFDGWLTFAGTEKTGYFEKEFGITDALCKKVQEEQGVPVDSFQILTIYCVDK